MVQALKGGRTLALTLQSQERLHTGNDIEMSLGKGLDGGQLGPGAQHVQWHGGGKVHPVYPRNGNMQMVSLPSSGLYLQVQDGR